MHWWWIVGATVVAALLRFTALGEWSFWVDEAHTWRDATMPLEGERGLFSEDRAYYALPFLALRGLLALGWIGGDEWGVRMPFAVVGVLAVPVLALCGRRLVGPTATVLAAWFCALDPWHVFWSQNARGYGLAFLFATLAVNRIAWWSDRRRWQDLLLGLLLMVLGFLCHPTVALQGASLLALLGLQRLPPLRGRVLGWSLLGAAALVLLLPILVAMFAPFQDFLRAKAVPSPFSSLLHFAQTTAYYYRPIVLLAAVGGAWLLFRDGERRRFLLLGCFAFVPIFVLLVVGSQVAKMTARYSICAFPVVLWLAAAACVALARRILADVAGPGLPLRLVAGLLPALVFADFAVHLQRYFQTQFGDRARWREACTFVTQRERAPGRGLWALTVQEPAVRYYLDPGHWRQEHDPGVAVPQVHLLADWQLGGGGQARLRKWVADAAANRADLVVMITLPELLEKDDGQVWPTLQSEFDLVLHLPCFVGPKDESVYVFVPRAP